MNQRSILNSIVILMVVMSVYLTLINVPIARASVNLTPGQDIGSIVEANPEGTEFIFSPGVYRMQIMHPKNNQIFTGQPGVILSGARLLTSFIREGNYWVATGQTQEGQLQAGDGCVTPGYPRCDHPEEFFINDVPLRHVDAKSSIIPGTYFFDYPADKIYFLDDPTGKKVETSVANTAFWGSAVNVTIQGLIVEKYAIPYQMGAIGDQYPGDGWIIKNNEVRWNHGAGIRGAGHSQILNNHLHDNGQMGFGANGDDVLVEGNEIDHNGFFNGVNVSWEAGGFKVALSNRLTVRNNNVHDNNGAGMWTDIDNINTLYENNTVTNNVGPGIFHEISYDAIIRNNTVKNNNYSSDPGWIWNGQIQIASSKNVEIYNNTVESNSGMWGNGIVITQANRDYAGCCLYGHHESTSINVHNNVITVTGTGTEGVTGAAQDYFNPDIFIPSSNNHFNYNIYSVPSLNNYLWTWNNQLLTWTGWKAAGQDLNGCASTNNSCFAASAGDLNLDHIINSIDWSIMNSKWFTNDANADLNHDGIVNAIDYSVLNANWFKTW